VNPCELSWWDLLSTMLPLTVNINQLSIILTDVLLSWLILTVKGNIVLNKSHQAGLDLRTNVSKPHYSLAVK
jgi:hypothetical protein